MMPLALLFLLTFGSTSDKQDIRSAQISAHPQSNINWLYPNEPASLNGWSADIFGAKMESASLDYERYQARAGYFLKLENKWTFEALVGMHQFKESRALEKSKSDPVGEIAIQRKADAALFGLKVQSHYALDRLAPLGGDIENLHSLSLKPDANYLVAPDWKVGYRGHYDFLKDGNTHSISDGQILRAISRDNLWLWLGFGSEYTTNCKRNAQYWSPSAAYSYGFRYDFAYGLNDSWTVLSGGGFHALREQKDGVGHYFTSTLQYGKRESFNARLTFESVNSLQGANHWSSETFSLSLISPF